MCFIIITVETRLWRAKTTAKKWHFLVIWALDCFFEKWDSFWRALRPAAGEFTVVREKNITIWAANKGNIDHRMCQSEILHRRCPVEDWVFFINHFWVSKLFSADTRANFGRLKDPWPRSRPPNSETRF